VVFESIPASITLPPNSGPHTITLSGTPKETGDLDIHGKFSLTEHESKLPNEEEYDFLKTLSFERAQKTMENPTNRTPF